MTERWREITGADGVPMHIRVDRIRTHILENGRFAVSVYVIERDSRSTRVVGFECDAPSDIPAEVERVLTEDLPDAPF